MNPKKKKYILYGGIAMVNIGIYKLNNKKSVEEIAIEEEIDELLISF